MENLSEKVFALAEKELAKIGINKELDINNLHADHEKISTYSHCGKVLNRKEEVKFSCADVYEMGGKLIRSLSKLYTFPKILKFDEERIELEVRKYLEKKSGIKAANMLKHL